MGITRRLIVECCGYEIDTHYTSEPDIVNQWLAFITEKFEQTRDEDELMIVGLDVEWAPFDMLRVPETLQLCVGTDCLVVKMKPVNYGLEQSGLVDFVADDRFLFSGLGIEEDIAKLERYYELQFHGQHFDIKEGAIRRKINCRAKYSLQSLARHAGGLRHFTKDTSLTMSDWSKSCLSNEQIAYAARDAFVSYYVAEII